MRRLVALFMGCMLLAVVIFAGQARRMHRQLVRCEQETRAVEKRYANARRLLQKQQELLRENAVLLEEGRKMVEFANRQMKKGA